MRHADFEGVVERELRRLPVPSAPETLVPRVMAAVRAWSERPWYERAWFTWPLAWQAASAVLLVLLVAGGVWVLPAAQAAVRGLSETFMARGGGDVSRFAQGTANTLIAVRAIWHGLLEPLVGYVFVLAALMCLAIAAVGLALNRVVLGRALHS